MPKGIYKRIKSVWNKGMKGRYLYPSPMKGKNHTKKTKEKISKTKQKNPIRYWLGKKRPEMSIYAKKRMKNPELIKISIQNLPKGLRGENHPSYKGGWKNKLPNCEICGK